MNNLILNRLLVIIMFLVCSGGGLGYRYWLQARYRATASEFARRTSNSRTQNSLRGTTCHAQQARISYNSARNTVLLHRMLKGIFITHFIIHRKNISLLKLYFKERFYLFNFFKKKITIFDSQKNFHDN